MQPGYDVVVLAGGAGLRLGRVDKPALQVGGSTLLERVLRAAAGGQRTVVVGPPRPGLAGALLVCEQPPGAGPVAAVQAGVGVVRAPVVVLLAADLPFVTEGLVATLVAVVARSLAEAAAGTGPAAGLGALVLDDTGRAQWLLSAWPTAGLRVALAGARPDASLRSVLAALPQRAVRPVGVDAMLWYDCDTPADLATARRHDRTHDDRTPDVADLDG